MKRSRIIWLGILFSFVIILVFGSITFHELKTGDFILHIDWAREFSQNGYIPAFPHSLFARLVSITRAMIPANIFVLVSSWIKHVWDLKSFDLSALIVVTLSYLTVAWLMLNRLIKNQGEEGFGKKKIWLIGGATLALMLVGPINLFTLFDRMYLGYFTGNAYHNPTYLLLRPFALLLFFVVSDNYFKKWNWAAFLLASFALISATYAKPSFTLTFLPAAAVVALINIKKWKQINKGLLASIAFLGVLILGWQYWVSYQGQTSDQIIFAPFKAILIHVPNVPIELFFALMSIVFPVSIAIIYWKEIRSQISFQLAWTNFLFGLGSAFLLAEKLKIAHLNFWWGPMIGLFILFYVSVEFWIKENSLRKAAGDKPSGVDYLLLGVFGLHVICGILYYAMVFLNTGKYIVP